MKRLILLFLLLLATGCIAQEQPTSGPPLYQAEKVATALKAPWSIQHVDQTFFISERAGAIVKITQDGQQLREDVHLSAPLASVAESGLLGFTLKKDFPESHEAFAYYTYDKEGTPINRIVTLRYDGTSWHEQAILLDNIESGPVHHGGRLALSPDGVLYATIGDGATPETAQDPASYNGKIIRFTPNNTVEIVSTGHRNPQGLAWDKNGRLFASEHGQSANDEINQIETGNNYGWPIIEGTETAVGMQTPLLTSGSNETWAPSGMTFHDGLLYVAALRGEAILVIDPQNGKLLQEIEGYGRIRDVFSDGESLYFITNNTDGRGQPMADDDALYRLN
ncbi:PQQ-dependent sugar dehydrogenase [Sporosarcina sp. FSL K6-1522]|uniref:PQQ-dependent sugar dehydrogenase n=1 Tax=Sporosarcina sp. FSL K6-1522 TaxID=2921554 RepID=UPI00315A75B5